MSFLIIIDICYLSYEYFSYYCSYYCIFILFDSHRHYYVNHLSQFSISYLKLCTNVQTFYNSIIVAVNTLIIFANSTFGFYFPTWYQRPTPPDTGSIPSSICFPFIPLYFSFYLRIRLLISFTTTPVDNGLK